MTLQIRQKPTLILYNVHLNYQHHRGSHEAPFLWSIWIKTRSSLSSVPVPGLTPSNLVYLITSSKLQQHVLRIELWSTLNTITGSDTLIFNFTELLNTSKWNVVSHLKLIVANFMLSSFYNCNFANTIQRISCRAQKYFVYLIHNLFMSCQCYSCKWFWRHCAIKV